MLKKIDTSDEMFWVPVIDSFEADIRVKSRTALVKIRFIGFTGILFTFSYTFSSHEVATIAFQRKIFSSAFESDYRIAVFRVAYNHCFELRNLLRIIHCGGTVPRFVPFSADSYSDWS